MSARASRIAWAALAVVGWCVVAELRRLRRQQALLNEMILMGVILNPDPDADARAEADAGFRALMCAFPGDPPTSVKGDQPCV